jgi:hypothetical protein
VSQHVLTDWPEDRLPTCSYSECRRDIKNGEAYTILPGTIKMLCSTCAPVEQVVESIKQEEQAQEEKIQRRRQYPARTAGAAARARAMYERTKRSAPAPRQPRTRRAYVGPPCAWCGAPCPGRGGAQSKRRYCLREHATLHRLTLNEPARKAREVSCPGCGKRFVPPSHGQRAPQKFCAISCAGYYHRKLSPRTCEQCLRSYTPARSEQKFCSVRCANRAQVGKRTGGRPRITSWSRKFDACIDCGSTTRRHIGHGRCSRCYYPPDLVPQEGPEETPELRRTG